MKNNLIMALTLAAVSGLAGAQMAKIPVQSADKTTVTKPPVPVESDMKGFGVRGVEGKTLADMLNFCRKPPASMSRVQTARCDQLWRTLKTQPDGTRKELADPKP
jgi:hypothetical protein